MSALHILPTISSPEVVFSFEVNKLIIKGICAPQYPILFFEPIIEAIEEYQKTKSNLTIDIYLDYFNTGSSKCLLNLFSKTAINPDIKINTIVNWIVESGDSELKEAGEVFQEITGLKFCFLSAN